MKKGLCADLMLTFMKIGLFTFGGGYAMISMISDICVEKKKWITHEYWTVADMRTERQVAADNITQEKLNGYL